MVTTIKDPVTKFKESKACRVSKKINPKAIDEDVRIFLKNRLMLKETAKNRGRKNEISCIELA